MKKLCIFCTDGQKNEHLDINIMHRTINEVLAKYSRDNERIQ